MPETFSEFKSRTTQLLHKTMRQKEGQFKQIRAAAVKMEHLLNDEKWDLFLGRLMPLLAEAKKEAADWLHKLAGAMTEEQTRMAQANYHSWSSRAQTLEEVLAMPKQIIEDGKDLPPAPEEETDHGTNP